MIATMVAIIAERSDNDSDDDNDGDGDSDSDGRAE